MDLEHYKAASERTDADERALIPGFKRMPEETRPESDAFVKHLRAQREAWDAARKQEEHDNDLRYESMVDYESWLTDANQHDERDPE